MVRDDGVGQGGDGRHRRARLVGEPDRGGDRGDDALDPGRRGQRRRARGRRRGNVLVDQRDGGLDRRGHGDDREPGGDRRAERAPRPSSCRGRCRASRRAAQRISDAADAAATSATQLERTSQSLALARQGGRRDRRARASRDAEEGGVSIQRSIQGFGRVRESMAQSTDGDPRDGQARQRHQQHRRHDQPDRRADQPAVAERLDRSGARRRRGPRVRGRGRGDPQPGRPVGQGDADIAGIIKALQEVAQEAVTRRTRACASSTRATCRRRRAPTGLRKILDGVTEATQVVAQIARAAEEQREAAKNVVGADHDDRRAGAPGRRGHRGAGEGGDGRWCRRTAQIRKTTQEVKKAMAEQARAARDILKAAQSHQGSVGAGPESDRGAGRRPPAQITQAAESMRRGAATTARALAEQATAGEQISRSAEELRQHDRQPCTRAMAEQATAMSQIAAASDEHAAQAEQTSRARQGTGARDAGDDRAPRRTRSKQIKLITHANREHSTVSASLLGVAGRDSPDHRPQRHRREATRGGTDDLRAPRQRAGGARRDAGRAQDRAAIAGRTARVTRSTVGMTTLRPRSACSRPTPSGGAHVGRLDRGDHRHRAGAGAESSARRGGAGARDARAADGHARRRSTRHGRGARAGAPPAT